LAAAMPVIENNPAPMMAPIPNAINPPAPNVLFRVWVPVSWASFINAAIGFLTNKLMLLVGFIYKISGKIRNKYLLEQPIVHFYPPVCAQQALNHILRN
jgi:hypothetical protein